MDDVILQGGGEHARVVLDCLLTSGRVVLALYDPKYDGNLMRVPQRGAYNPAEHPQAMAVVAIGDNATRKQVVAKTQHGFTQAVHASAIISPHVKLGEGVMILHGAIIQAFSRIGNHTILNTGVRVDHDCVIGDFVHLAPGAILCGTVEVGEGTLIGAGAIIIPGKKIGRWSVIGAGSVVTTNIPDHVVAVGNPARVIKSLTP